MCGETELQVLKEFGRGAQAESCIRAQLADGCGKDATGRPIRLRNCAPSRTTMTATELYASVRKGTLPKNDGYDAYDALTKSHEFVHFVV
jgi:transposase